MTGSRGSRFVDFWRLAPFAGLLSLITAFLTGVATIIVLVTSNNQPIEDWRVGGYDVQPTVVLSILATIANLLLRNAFAAGMSLTWWNAAHDGSTVGHLHYLWQCRESSLAVFTSIKYFSGATLATLLMALVLVDGPFLQRASSVGVIDRSVPVNLTANVAPCPISDGLTGLFGIHQVIPTLFTQDFARVLKQYNNRVPIPADWGCEGICAFDIIGPGWDIDCGNWTTPYRLLSENEDIQLSSSQSSESLENTLPAVTQTMFWSNVSSTYTACEDWDTLQSYITGKRPTGSCPFPSTSMFVSTMYKSDTAPEGNLLWEYCVLREAIQRYPVVVTNNTLVPQPLSRDQNFTVSLVNRGPDFIEEGGVTNNPSTFGGFYLALSNTFAGFGNLTRAGSVYSVQATGLGPLTYIHSPNAASFEAGNLTWSSPIDDELAMLQELTLRTAIGMDPQYTLDIVNTSNGHDPGRLIDETPLDLRRCLNVRNQTVLALQTSQETVYQSHFDWLGGAVAIMFLALLAVASTFFGWWRLHRPVTMSPAEIAKAFHAPLLDDVGRSRAVDDVLRLAGKKRVRFSADCIGEEDEKEDDVRDSERAHMDKRFELREMRSGSSGFAILSD